MSDMSQKRTWVAIIVIIFSSLIWNMPTYYGIEDDRFWPAILVHHIFTFPHEELLPKDVNRMGSIYKHIFKYDHYLYT